MGKLFILPLQLLCLLLWAECGMASTAEIVASILDLTEKEFFSADRSVFAPRESRLLDMDFWGVAVNAPRQIWTDHHDKLPLIMATRFSGERGWEVRLRDNCILVGTNLQDGSVHFANALVTEKLTELDARGRLHIRWNTGIWSLGVIYYDWSSNTVVVDLKGDEEVKPRLARSVRPEPNPLGVPALPCYLPMPQTPQPPDSGISFRVEFRVEQGQQKLNVFGAFALPVRELHLPQQKVVHQFKDGRKENVAAVVPVTLAVLALDWDLPLRFDWAVPVYGEELKVGLLARGCFAFDALPELDDKLPNGKYVAYVIIEGEVYGPVRFEIPKKDK